MTLERRLEICQRRMEMATKYWMRAARKALDGDLSELRNRVEMYDAGPVKLVLSDSQQGSPE